MRALGVAAALAGCGAAAVRAPVAGACAVLADDGSGYNIGFEEVRRVDGGAWVMNMGRP